MLTDAWVQYSAAGACLQARYQKPPCETNTCLEAAIDGERVLVRNSTDPDGPIVEFTPEEWQTFLNGVRTTDTFDLPLDARVRLDLTKVT